MVPSVASLGGRWWIPSCGVGAGPQVPASGRHSGTPAPSSLSCPHGEANSLALPSASATHDLLPLHSPSPGTVHSGLSLPNVISEANGHRVCGTADSPSSQRLPRWKEPRASSLSATHGHFPPASRHPLLCRLSSASWLCGALEGGSIAASFHFSRASGTPEERNTRLLNEHNRAQLHLASALW